MRWITIILFILLISCKKETTPTPPDDNDDDTTHTEMATYYIDPTGVNNPGRDGTSTARAWRTLSYACSRVTTTGNIIHANAGSYSETAQSILRVGVSIEGAGQGVSVFTSTVTSVPTIYAYSSSYNTDGNQHISGISLISSNPSTVYAGISIINRRNVRVYNCTITNFNYSGVQFYNGNDNANYATGNEIYGCIITDCGFFRGINEGCLSLMGQDGILIHNNIMTTSGFSGNHGDCIKAVDGFVKNIKIYNNTLTNVFVSGTTHWDFAIEIWNWFEGNEIYGNTIIGSVDISRAWGKGTGTYCVWVHDNIIGQTAQTASESTHGILFEHNIEDVIVERNYIQNVCQGIPVNTQYADVTVANVRVSYNIFYNIGVSNSGSDSKGWGILWGAGDGDHVGTTVIDNILIYNNVFVGSTSARTCMWGIELPDSGIGTDVSVRNNIVINFDYAPTYARQGALGGVTIDRLSIENNIFYGNGNSNLPRYGAGITPTNNTTQNNIIDNPDFTSATDFYLQASSPAINAGLDVGLTVDYDNNAVSNPPEIGAYERLSGVSFTNAKRLNIYRGYTAVDLKARASVPNVADIDVGATYIDCINITTSKIETALIIDDNSIEDLCQHPNVNKWSGFSPYYRTIVGGMLTHNKPADDLEGDFAGYNHNAAIPHFDSITHDDEVWIIPTEVVHFAPTINIGELKYIGGDIVGHSDCVGMALTVWDGITLVAEAIINLSGETDIIYPDATLTGGSTSKTYTCKLYLVDDLGAFDYTLTHVVGQIAELPNYTKLVSVKQGSGATLSAPPGWSISGTPLSFTLSSGAITFQGLHNPSYTGHLIVSAYVTNWLGVKVTDDTYLYNANYSGNYGIIIGSIVIWKIANVTQPLPVAAYGYTATVFVNPA